MSVSNKDFIKKKILGGFTMGVSLWQFLKDFKSLGFSQVSSCSIRALTFQNVFFQYLAEVLEY